MDPPTSGPSNSRQPPVHSQYHTTSHSHNPSSSQHPLPPPSSESSSTMIGPASSFYDPELEAAMNSGSFHDSDGKNPVHRAQAQRYQQWIDSYGHGSQQGMHVGYQSQQPLQQQYHTSQQYQGQTPSPGSLQPSSQFNFAHAFSSGSSPSQMPYGQQSQSQGYTQSYGTSTAGFQATGAVGYQDMYSQSQSQSQATQQFSGNPNRAFSISPSSGSSNTWTTEDPNAQVQSSSTAYTSIPLNTASQQSQSQPPSYSISVHQPAPQQSLPRKSLPSRKRPSPAIGGTRTSSSPSRNVSTTTAPIALPTLATQNLPQPQAGGSRISAPSPPNANKRKRPRPPPKKSSTLDTRGSDSDGGSEDDEFGGGINVGLGGIVEGAGRGRPVRPAGACTHCKKLKMKCDFPEDDNTCKRCKAGGHVCIVEGRKPRTAPNKREYLLAQIRQKDAIIESLLKQLHNPYLATPLSIASYRMATSPTDQNNKNVLAWLDRLQASVRDASGKKAKGQKQAYKDLRSGVLAEEGQEDSTDQEEGTQKMSHAQRFGLVAKDSKNDNTSGGAETATEGGGDDAFEGGDSESTAESTFDAQDPGEQNATTNPLPDLHVPLGLIASLSLSNNPKAKAAASARKEGNLKDDAAQMEEDNLDDDNVGVANETYFLPGPAYDLDIRAHLIEQHAPPEILVHGLVTPDDVEKLFEIFYSRVNPFVSLLDPVLHNPASTFARCPFLFTVICAVSSRYYADKSEIYPIAMHFARHSAANALTEGWKSVELCQAYILMSIYSVPARRWEEDRSWLFTGLAIRLATDLNLHQTTLPKNGNEKQIREALNRQRVWIICYNLDRSTATQFGRPSTMKDDYMVHNINDWYKRSPYNLAYDIHMVGHTELLRIVNRFHETIFSDPRSPTGLNKNVDFRSITIQYDQELTAFNDDWSRRFDASKDNEDAGGAFRRLLLPFLVSYSRLVMFSFGFQQSYKRGVESGDNFFFTNCLESAKSVIRCMVEDLAPSGYMRYAPDGHFVFVSFASAFLLKLLRPEFTHLLSREDENEIFDYIGRLIHTISNSTIAIDDRHTPKLYARFLAGLLSKHRRDGATIGRLQTLPPLQSQFTPTSQQSLDFTQHSQQQSMSTTFASIPHHQDNLDIPSDLPPSYQNIYTTQPLGMGPMGGSGSSSAITPIYRPEATFAGAGGAIQIGGSDFEMFNMDGNSGMEEEMLATMQALRNPNWWNTMMMPGFSWPDPGSPASNASGNSSMSSPGYSGVGSGNNTIGYGMFPPKMVPLP